MCPFPRPAGHKLLGENLVEKRKQTIPMYAKDSCRNTFHTNLNANSGVCSPSRGGEEKHTCKRGGEEIEPSKAWEAKTDTVHIATSTRAVGHYIMVLRTNHTPRQYWQDRQESWQRPSEREKGRNEA